MIRALIGDLAVATVELAAVPSPASATGPERFARLYRHGYKLFLLAVEVGVTRAIDREVVDVEMIAPLVEAFEGTMLLYQLWTRSCGVASRARTPTCWRDRGSRSVCIDRRSSFSEICCAVCRRSPRRSISARPTS